MISPVLLCYVLMKVLLFAFILISTFQSSTSLWKKKEVFCVPKVKLGIHMVSIIIATINAKSLEILTVLLDLVGERSPLPLKTMSIYTGFIHSKCVKLLSQNCQLTQQSSHHCSGGRGAFNT